MKKFFYLMMMALVPLCFTACSSDDDDEEENGGSGKGTAVIDGQTINLPYGFFFIEEKESKHVGEGKAYWEVNLCSYDHISVYKSRDVSALPSKFSIVNIAFIGDAGETLPEGEYTEYVVDASIDMSYVNENNKDEGKYYEGYVRKNGPVLKISKSGSEYVIEVEGLSMATEKDGKEVEIPNNSISFKGSLDKAPEGMIND